ncbi:MULTISPECIES: helix-turn-helix transcriptional regulator [unclassified Staphylococcus]|uniref:helix-turn-helix domain-containing protein n=1 Tax=unclassified Staphylococcus TaxID=91994 RepID=UPI0021D134CE|nr:MULTISPECIES: helix-turn-helix transcriptional regulator [unclassified Staphylococcus]UXR76766.1 helix-turn-helix domain-containing protein [Staphylococcus sp. IVB6233]UXR80895.1 helix-turn-helix domain-containing protein [Staphylococcus sp. IVB6218]
MYDKKEIGKRIREIRMSLGKTQEQFGDLFSASKGNVAMWEKGATLPNKKRLLEISQKANITLDELLFGDIFNYIYININYDIVEDLFDDFDMFAKHRIADLIYSVTYFKYPEVFERKNYKEILTLCENNLRTEVELLIADGKKAYASFNSKPKILIDSNKDSYLVNLYLQDSKIKNIDYIIDFRFLVNYAEVNNFKFDEELINYNEPIMELYEILSGYFNKTSDVFDLIDKSTILINTLENQNYDSDPIGEKLINFIKNDMNDTFVSLIEDKQGDTHDT